MTTDSERVRLRYEPSAPSIRARLRTARALVEAGVPIGISVSPMLPMDDLEGFAREIASLEAAEYVSQYMQPPSRVFAAGTRPETLRKAREDGWTPREYAQARAVIEGVLGPRRPLLEGDERFAPVP